MTVISDAISFECIGDYSCAVSNLTGIGDLTMDCSASGYQDACSLMTIAMNNTANTKVRQTRNTFLCGTGDDIDSNDTVSSYACLGTELNSFADIITFDCNNEACYNTRINLYNDDSQLHLNCTGYDACGLMKVTSNGHLESMMCSGLFTLPLSLYATQIFQKKNLRL